MLHVYVDADACPVKDETFRVAARYGLPVTLVANARMQHPRDRVRLVVVDRGADAADDWIAGRVEPGDIVVTADIPLAARCLDRGARVLGPRGREFTPANVGDALAERHLQRQLREQGLVAGGPAPFAPKDRSRFLQALDALVHAIRRDS